LSGIFVGTEDGLLSSLSTPCVLNRSVRFPEQGMAWKIPGASTSIDQGGRLQTRRIFFRELFFISYSNHVFEPVFACLLFEAKFGPIGDGKAERDAMLCWSCVLVVGGIVFRCLHDIIGAGTNFRSFFLSFFLFSLFEGGQTPSSL
jgi:hypothetical protein